MTDTQPAREGRWPTPQEFVDEWEAASPNGRLARAENVIRAAQAASERFTRADYEIERLRDAQAENERRLEECNYRNAVLDVLRARHEGGDGSFWADWHRDHCAAAQAAADARSRAEAAEATIQALTAVAEGRIAHRFMGGCPDSLDGYDQRDPDCPACRVLDGAGPDTQDGAK